MFKSFLSKHIKGIFQLSCRDRLARLRAYRQLQFSQGEKPIFDFINNLVQTTYLLPPDSFRGFVPDGYQERTTLAFRQKLLRTTVDNDLSSGVMMAVASSPSIFPARLPGEWRRALSVQGLKVHRFSSLLWGYVLLQKLKEAIEFYRYFGRNHAFEVISAPFALLLGMPSRAYAGLTVGDKTTYTNFASWFRQRHPGLDLHIVTGFPQAERLEPHVKLKPHMWPPLRDNVAYNQFRRCARRVIWHSLLAFMGGRWEFMFMARDVIELNYIMLADDVSLPQRVALTNSHYIYRPLWSYYLEDRGIETGIYFYSTNTFNIALRNGEYGQIYGYNLMSWSHYYVTTLEQAAFLEGANPYPKVVSVVGAIPLEDNGVFLPEKDRPVVAYFDVQPFRDAFMSSIGRPCPLYFYEASRRNLEDISAVCKAHGFSLVLKPKRDVGNRLCPRYKRLVKDMATEGDIIVIDSYIAAERVADWADAVICQPFTSVAVVGHNLGKPSVYYDALGLYKKEQPAAQGQAVLQDRADLSRWLGAVNKSSRVSSCQDLKGQTE